MTTWSQTDKSNRAGSLITLLFILLSIAIGIISPTICLVSYTPLTLVMLAITIFIWFRGTKREDILSLPRIALLSFSIFYVIPAVDLTFVLPLTRDPLPYRLYHAPIGWADEMVIVKAYFVVVLGMLFFWLGYFVLGRRLTYSKEGNGRERECLLSEMVLSQRRVVRIALVYLLLAGIAIENIIRITGGWSSWYSSHWYYKFNVEQPSPALLLLNQLQILLLISYYILLVTFFKWRSRRVLLLVIAILCLNVSYWSIAGTRKNVMWLILGSVIAWHYLRRRLTMRKAVSLFAAAVLLLIFLSPFRSVVPINPLSEAPRAALELISQQPWPSIVRGTIDFVIAHDTFLTIIEKIGVDVAPVWGATYAKLLFVPIPRTIWPSKPVGAGGVAVEALYGSDAFGVSQGVTVIGEAYLNFLLPGVIIVLSLLGIIVRLCWEWFRPRLGTVQGTLLYMILVPYVVELFRSDFFVTFEYSIQLVAIMVALWFSGVRSRK
jgi:hypothetical protein